MLMSCTPNPSPAPQKHVQTPDSLAQQPTLTDQRGHTIDPQQPATRIVSLSPALTESLFALGCGRKIVLRDGWSDYPPAALQIPNVQGFTPSPEAILAAKPDLVVTNFPPLALANALDAAHIHWLAFAPRNFADITQTLRALGQACGQAQKGEALAQAFDKRLQQLDRHLQTVTLPQVFYEMDAGIGGQPFTVGKKTFGHALVVRAGGVNVFGTQDREWFQVSPESVLEAEPEVVLLADADAADQPQNLESLKHRPTMALLRAVRQGQVFPLHAALVSRPGPRLVLGVEEIARLLHPLALLDMPILQPL